jgi:hypothetical protein
MTTPTMTRGERSDLAKLVRQRAKVAKDQTAQRAAELRADFEKQLAAIYRPSDDPVWKELHAHADAVVAQAQEQLAARCQQLGIASEFAPRLRLDWYSRGENASRERRVELRAVAFWLGSVGQRSAAGSGTRDSAADH